MSQTHEASLSGTKVDEHAITRKVLGERRRHVREIGRKVKSIGSSTSSTIASHANFGSGPSYCPTLGEFAARAEAKQCRETTRAYGESIRCLVASWQSQIPNLQIQNNLFPSFQQFDQVDQDEEDDEDDDADLGATQVFYCFV